MWQVEGVADKDEPTENYQSNLWLPSFFFKELYSSTFSSLFSCQANNVIVL